MKSFSRNATINEHDIDSIIMCLRINEASGPNDIVGHTIIKSVTYYDDPLLRMFLININKFGNNPKLFAWLKRNWLYHS